MLTSSRARRREDGVIESGRISLATRRILSAWLVTRRITNTESQRAAPGRSLREASSAGALRPSSSGPTAGGGQAAPWQPLAPRSRPPPPTRAHPPGGLHTPSPPPRPLLRRSASSC
eukprot:1180106-Prorocentrum_minimum.AAC.5